MNDDRRKFRRQTQNPLLCAAGALVLASCAGLPEAGPFVDATIDPRSPAAAAVAREAAAPGAYPTFADIPPVPTDVRSPAQWRQAVDALTGERQALLANTAPATFSLHDTDAFAARMRAAVNVQPGDVPTEAQMAETEAFARRMRQRATPPPRPR